MGQIWGCGGGEPGRGRSTGQSGHLDRPISPSPTIAPNLALTDRTPDCPPHRGATLCAGLYLVRADGSGATRLTTTGRSPTGAFSPDGRRIAYSRSGAPGTITTLDLETGATVDQLCGSDYSSFEIHWSPSGERIAVDCDFSLTILNAAGTTAPVRFMTGGDPLAFSWTDDRHLVVATEGGDLYSFDVVSQSSSLLGRFADAEIEIVSTSGVFSPDGRWLAYHGGERGDVPGNDFTEVGYLVPTSGGTPTRIPGDVNESTTWSGDSRALVSISGQDTDLILVRMDIETLQSSTIGTILDQDSYLTPTEVPGGS